MMNSIRARLIVVLILAMGGVWSIGVLWSYHSTRGQIEQVLDARLMESARMVSSMVSARSVDMSGGAGMSPWQAGEGYSRQLSCQIWRLDGTLMSSSDNAPLETMNDHQEGFGERELNGEVWRSYAIYNEDAGVRVLVGDKVEFRAHLIGDVVRGLLFPLLLVLPVIGGLIWWAVSRGLRPLERMASSLAGRDATRLEPLVAAGAPSELRPPIAALNALLTRVEQARDHERAFTSYAAHELKTPLAGLKTQAQIAIASDDPAIKEHALGQILRGVDRTDRLVRQLLDLAKVDMAEPQSAPGNTDINDVLADVLNDLGTLAQTRSVTVSIASAASIRLDRNKADLLHLALRNTIENAILVSNAGDQVVVSMDDSTEGFSITVSDCGPGMSDDEIATATARFYRGPHGSEMGSGLGLAIVEAVTRRLEGQLRFLPNTSKGLSVQLSAPA